MKVEIKDTSDTRKVATVEFEPSEVAEEEKKVLRLFAQHAKVPGFRPGKAPDHVIRSQFANRVMEEWGTRLSTSARDAVLEHDDLRVHQLLKIEPGEILVDAPVEVVVTLDVEPPFDLPEYEGFKLESPSDEPSQEDVDQLIESWRQQRADFAVVDRAAEAGDYVKCSYEGSIDEKPISELLPDKPIYGKQSNTWEEAGAEGGIGVAAIVDGVVGMKAGDKKTCEAEFPEDFEVEQLAGKTGTYELEVHETRHKELPELADQKFLKSMEVDTVEALQERAEQEAKAQLERSNQASKRSQTRDQLLEAIDFELPQADLERETQDIFRYMVESNVKRGVAQQDLETHKDEMFARAGEDARETVKLRIILGRIAEKEELKVNQEELTQVIATQAMMAGADPREHFSELQKDRSKLAALQQQILFDKTLALIMEKALITIKENDEENDQSTES
ncbi:MAG: trigger factor [Opitutales bacterium]